MSTYRAATGNDVALGSLTVLDPQPDENHPGGIQHTRITRSLTGSLNKEGAYIDLTWTEISATDYATLLSTFGLSSADNADVTVYVRDVDLSTWVRKNGVAQRPLPGETATWNFRPRQIVVRVTDLEDAA